MTTPAYVEIVLSWGLIGVGLLAFGEKIIPVVPSSVLLLFLGMRTISGWGDLILTIGATAAGSAAGALCWYGCGRAFGRARSEAWVARYGRFIFLSPSFYRRMADAYRRDHFWVTLLGQTIPMVRLYLPIPAGVFEIAPGAFAVATLLGCVAWNTPLLILGYALRDTGHDPFYVGLLAVAGLMVAELAFLFMLRVRPAR